MRMRVLRAAAMSVVLVLAVLPRGHGQINFMHLQVGDLWDATDGMESPLGLLGIWLVWPAGGETGSSSYEGGARTNSTGARLRFMIKDYVSETKDSLGNVIRRDTIPYYHPNYAAKTPTQAYQPAQTKYVRTYRTPTTVTYEDGSVHANAVDRPGPLLIENPKLISDEMV